MVRLLIFGCTAGIRSFRAIKGSRAYDIACPFLAADHAPYFRSNSRSRRGHLDAPAGPFSQSPRLAMKLGMVKDASPCEEDRFEAEAAALAEKARPPLVEAEAAEKLRPRPSAPTARTWSTHPRTKIEVGAEAAGRAVAGRAEDTGRRCQDRGAGDKPRRQRRRARPSPTPVRESRAGPGLGLGPGLGGQLQRPRLAEHEELNHPGSIEISDCQPHRPPTSWASPRALPANRRSQRAQGRDVFATVRQAGPFGDNAYSAVAQPLPAPCSGVYLLQP
jgi:hypothetical protein